MYNEMSGLKNEQNNFSTSTSPYTMFSRNTTSSNFLTTNSPKSMAYQSLHESIPSILQVSGSRPRLFLLYCNIPRLLTQLTGMLNITHQSRNFALVLIIYPNSRLGSSTCTGTHINHGLMSQKCKVLDKWHVFSNGVMMGQGFAQLLT